MTTPYEPAPQQRYMPIFIGGFLVNSAIHVLLQLSFYANSTSTSFSPSLISHFLINTVVHSLAYLLIERVSRRFFLRQFPAYTYPRLMSIISTILVAHGLVEITHILAGPLIALLNPSARAQDEASETFNKVRWTVGEAPRGISKITEVLKASTDGSETGAAKVTEVVKEAVVEATGKVKEAVSKIVGQVPKIVNSTVANGKPEL